MKSKLFSFFSIITLVFSNGVCAFGDLTVVPTRAVFEGRDRSQTISLVNRGTTTSTFRIEFTEMAMDEFGGVKEITEFEQGQFPASSLIKYSPRQVTIAPGESQTVRLLLRKPSDLEPGEYRSHLLMYGIPQDSVNSETLQVQETLKDGEVGIQLNAIFRVAIPVIVRNGDLSSTFELSNVSVTGLDINSESSPNLEFSLTRSGARSVYADIDVIYKSRTNPEESFLLGKVKDYVVYVPNKVRTTKLPLEIPEDMEALDGTIEVQFYKSENGKKEVLASTLLDV